MGTRFAYVPGCLLPLRRKFVYELGFRTAPPSYEIVSFHRRIVAGFAIFDIVEAGGIARCHIVRVDFRVDEADCRRASLSPLLVDQRDKACPHGRGEAGATISVRPATGLIGAG